MRYWLDTEFIEDGKTIDLLSIGIVAEDGRELYCESYDAKLSKADAWVRENVIAHLWNQLPTTTREGNWAEFDGRGGLMSRLDIAREVLSFCNPKEYGPPEFWGYYADYDWVVFCQLFGRMIDLPAGFPMFCRDIQQLRTELGVVVLPSNDEPEHHALADARWNRKAHEFLATLTKEEANG